MFKKVAILGTICGLVLSILLALSLTMMCLNVDKSNNEEINSLLKSEHYRYFRYNKVSKKSTRGITEIYPKIEGEGDMFFEEGDYMTLISNFSSKEYVCTGSCYCEDAEGEDSRRNSQMMSKKALFYLTASLSSTLAISKASEYFEKRCQEEMSQMNDECLSSVQSEVEVCEDTDDTIIEEDDEIIEVLEELEGGIKLVQKDYYSKSEYLPVVLPKKYICVGNCVRIVYPQEELHDLSTSFGCDKLKKKGPVELYYDDPDIWLSTPYLPQKVHDRFLVRAKYKFRRQYLKGWCQRNSMVTYKGKEMSMCSHKTSFGPPWPRNSIICVLDSYYM